MKCSIVALNHCPLSSVSGPMEILSLAVNLAGARDTWEIALLGESKAPINCNNGLQLTPHHSIGEVDQSDLVIVGAIGPPTPKSLNFSPNTLGWIQQQYQNGAQIVSICTGAFVLAASGILDGKTATTHWACAQAFEQLYPKVLLKSEEIITQDGSIYCSGGASSYQDMSLFLVRKYLGHHVAQQCAKTILIDLDRHNQSRYASYTPYRQHKDKVIHQLQDWLDIHFRSNFQIPLLAEKAHMSERQLKRRFSQATGESPLAYIQAMRIEFAKQRLESTMDNVETIGRESGYEDIRFFRQLFKRHTGLTPLEYRNKFQV